MHWYRFWLVVYLLAFALLAGGCIEINLPPAPTPPVTSELSPAATETPIPSSQRSVSTGGSQSKVSTRVSPSPVEKVAAPIEGRILDTRTQEIASTGGSISLKDGISLVIPPGAVDAGVNITMEKLDPAAYFDSRDLERVVLRFTAPVKQFKRDVEIRLALPQGMTEADSPDVLAGQLDETTGAVIVLPSRIRMIDGKPVVVFATNHFSSYSIEYQRFLSEKPPKSYNPPEFVIPYYSQGATLYCWAASLEMLIQAAQFDFNNKVYDIVGEMNVEAGLDISYFSEWLRPGLTNVIRERTGLRPDRHIWFMPEMDQLKHYLMREIGIRKRPVALFSSLWYDKGSDRPGHAVVVVGYDGDTIYVNDPRNANDKNVGYTIPLKRDGTPKTWKDIVNELTPRAWIITLDLPTEKLDPNRSDVTVNITDKAFVFQKPMHGGVYDPDYEGGESFNFVWDYTIPQGYSIRGTRAGTALLQNRRYTSLPGHTKQLRLESNKIEIVNSSRTATKAVTVLVDIVSMGQSEVRYTIRQKLSLPPNSRQYFNIDGDEIDIDKFRSNRQGPTEYVLHVTVLDGENPADWATIFFPTDKEDITISSLDKKQGPVGTRVTIKGRGFGTIQGSSSEKTFETANENGKVSGTFKGELSQVTFNRTPAARVISWEDDKIVVDVPPGATTGNVIVKRGAVESNPQVFTVTGATTVGGEISTSPRLDVGGPWKASVKWEMMGTGIEKAAGAGADVIKYWVDGGAPSRLTITAAVPTPEQPSFRDKDPDGSAGSYRIITYGKPKLKPFAANPRFWLEGDTWGVSGDFPSKISSSENSVTVDFTFPNRQEVLQIRILFEVPVTVERYSRDGVLVSKSTRVYDLNVNRAEVWSRSR